MNRRRQTPPRRIPIPIQELHALVERTRSGPLPEAAHATLKAAVETLARLTAELESTQTTLARVQRIVFGSSTETTAAVLGEEKAAESPPTDARMSPAATAGETNPGAAASEARLGTPDTASADSDTEPQREKKKRPGHGRNGAEDSPRAPRIAVGHATLKHGDPCPEPGGEGRLDVQRREPALLVRVTGVALLAAQVYGLERLRCGRCGTVFTAEPPVGVGESKYDETAAAMIALLKYGCGLPFHRIQPLEKAMAIPWPAATPWEVVQPAAARLTPAFAELAEQAAEGTVLYNDDTTMRLLHFTQEARVEALPPGARADRTGVFPSGLVAETAHGPIALFKTGPCPAGEPLAEGLDRREAPQPPIQMSDGLARNQPGDHPTQAASCIPHARRQYVEVAEAFPDEVAFVLKTLCEVFCTDQQARQKGLSPLERLLLHPQESAPRMKTLDDWMARQFAEHPVEPHSGLGQAISYLQNHGQKLTRFLRVPGAPLDNHIGERALKKAILPRKNALFYRTLSAARVGDLFMSLIHTAELHQIEPFHSLVALQRQVAAVALDPSAWMPWNYAQALARAEAPAAKEAEAPPN